MPFTIQQFFEVFERYNQAIFPLQFVLVLAASAIVMLVVTQKRFADEIISGMLAFLWLWAGIVYHLVFFAPVNSGAYIFGAFFIAQGVFLFHQGIIKKRLKFQLKPDFYGVLGMAFITYAVVLYPIIGALSGHIFPLSPTFGAPCPTTIFTFGLLMWTDEKLARPLLVIPLLWAFVGSLATFSFGIAEDFGLLLTALSGTFFILRRELFIPRRGFSPKKKEIFL
ncbi:MAG TPA: DUF6064 family protein [Pyrinomonadaceae bacterium]|nr:DUF6064 family protein [Pyrinomonadaceae bacterium]